MERGQVRSQISGYDALFSLANGGRPAASSSVTATDKVLPLRIRAMQTKNLGKPRFHLSGALEAGPVSSRRM